MTIKIAASKSPWLFSLMFILTQNFPFNSSDRVAGGGIYGAGAWTTVPPFESGPRGDQEGGMAEEIKSFLISFGTYLFFTFAWWALKAGFDAGGLLVLVFLLNYCVVNVVFVRSLLVYRRLRNRFPDALEEDRYAIKWSR